MNETENHSERCIVSEQFRVLRIAKTEQSERFTIESPIIEIFIL